MPFALDWKLPLLAALTALALAWSLSSAPVTFAAPTATMEKTEDASAVGGCVPGL